MKIKIGGRVFSFSKFRRRFKTYKMGLHPASTLETFKSRAKIRMPDKTFHKYLLRYLNNPLYMKNVFSYMFGNLYRAALGIKKVWNLDHERKVVSNLSSYLSVLDKNDLYWVKEFKATSDILVQGVLWENENVKPDMTAPAIDYNTRIEIPLNTRICIRLVNNPDPEHAGYDEVPHADLDFYKKIKGVRKMRKRVIATIPFSAYYNVIRDKVREL